MSYKLFSKIEKLLSNKWILNFIVAVSFLNVISFIMLNETVALVYFILIGLIMFYFSKNMSIVLLVPLILVNLFIGSSYKSSSHTREGLENNPDSESSKEKNIKGDSTKKNSPPSGSSGNSLIISPLDNQHNDENDNTAVTNKQQTGEPFEVGRNNKNKKGYDIDYASTVEDAYDDLNKILGSDGIKRLTSDTQSLVKQQMKLAESMKSMEPLIAGMSPIMKQAQDMLSSLGSNGDMGNLAKIAEQFNSSMKK